MKLLIGGEKTEAMSGATFENRNPYNNELVCTVPKADARDFERAAELAHQAQPAWAKTPIYLRSRILEKFVSLVRRDFEKIVDVICREGGKVITEARAELDTLCVVFTYYIQAANHLLGNTVPIDSEARTVGDVIFTIREPIGTFVSITPYNFPVELYAHKVAPCLITGNAVLIKPASDTPLSAYLLTELLWEAGVPGGVAQLVTGSGAVMGEWLKKTCLVDGVGFTGSTAVGKTLMEGGGAHLQHVFLELGGNDPYVVFDSADMDVAVSQAIGGRTWNAGQTCCANKRFLVQNNIRQAFTERLVQGLREVKMGDPMQEDTVVGPLINEQQAKEVISQIERTVAQGARCILGGTRDGAFVSPTVLVDVTPDMDVAKDMEIFGPVFPIIGFDTFEQAVEIANQTSYGLASGVITQDINTAMKFAKAVQAGTCVVNSSGNYRSAHQPFGGYKDTGIGREGTMHTLYEVTQEKTIVLKNVLAD